MSTKKIYQDKRLIFWEGQKNEDFIRHIAERTKVYANDPVVRNFALDKSPQNLYDIAKNMIHYAKDPRDYIQFLNRLVQLFGDDYKPYINKYQEFLQKRQQEMELLIAPPVIIEMLQRRIKIIGDCDDKTLFLASCLLSKGYSVKIVGAMLVKPNARGINHVYLEYQNEKGEWIPLEASTILLGFGQKSEKAVPLLRILVYPALKE